ncbi:MAG: hypothetical protein AAGJ35_07760, partial [Myxococcota bacterium]
MRFASVTMILLRGSIFFLFCDICWIEIGVSQAQRRAQQTGEPARQPWKQLSLDTLPFQIKARTSLTMNMRRHYDGQPQISGRLLQDQNKGVSQQTLWFAFDKAKRPVITDPEGNFALKLPRSPGRHRFSIRFPGNDLYQSSASSASWDLRRLPVQMKLELPSKLPDGCKKFSFAARLFRNNKPLPKQFLRVLAPRQERTKKQKRSRDPCQGRRLVQKRTNLLGRAAFTWMGSALQGPTSIPLCVVFPGTAHLLPLRRSFVLKVVAPPAQIGWVMAQRFGLVLLFLLIVAWILRKTVPSPNTETTLQLQKEQLFVQEDREVVLPKSKSKRAQHRSFRGILWDPYEQMPIPNAQCFLVNQKTTRKELLSHTNPQGEFEWSLQEQGRFEVLCVHPAYRAKRFTFHCPHDGQGHQLKLSLFSYRFLCFEVFRHAARIFDQAFSPRKHTAREFLREREEWLPDTMILLTAAYEYAYYAPVLVDQSQLTSMLEQLE